MSKNANAGELRTPVQFCRIVSEIDSEGIPFESKVNIFGEGKTVKCKWINAHGTESFTAMQLQITEPATLTCRFSPQIKQDQLVYRGADPTPYEIISIDNVGERNQWLEIKVKRKEAAR